MIASHNVMANHQFFMIPHHFWTDTTLLPPYNVLSANSQDYPLFSAFKRTQNISLSVVTIRNTTCRRVTYYFFFNDWLKR